VFISPESAVLERGTVLVRDGLIAAVGSEVPVPVGAEVISCDGCAVLAGFWNAHVHFTEAKWNNAAHKDAPELDAALADMLTSRGFTTVVDAGSDPRDTISLRRRIESLELKGPAIFTAGRGLFPPKGIPFYLRNSMPSWLTWFVLQPDDPDEAAGMVERNIAMGADLLKLFTGSYVERGKVLPMPEPIATRAVQVAHRHGQLVYSHPSDLTGTKVAINSGVDVLAHAPDTTGGIDTKLLKSIVARRMAMIPTLKMFGTTVTKKRAYLDPIYALVREFHELGGDLIFGTDVGYMTAYTTGDELHALEESGLAANDVLRMLTTAPAERFGLAASKGTIEPGKLADLVVLQGDPASDVMAFSQVRFTIRNGQVIYAKAR
jgi:imidazolonepropionase-like amidohydrolase